MARPPEAPRAAEVGQTMLHDAVGRRITLVLGQHRLDVAPLEWVIAELDVSERMARHAIARHPGLGTTGRPGRPLVWSTHPAPIAAGFRPTLVDDDHLVLRLPGPQPLFLSGRHLGAAPAEQIVDGTDETGLGEPGIGELGYVVARMAFMARQWLTVAHPPAAEAQRAQWLFERIAHAWRHSSAPITSIPGLQIHRVAFESPVGIRYWLDPDPTHELELVTWTDAQGRQVLVNAYPSGTERQPFRPAVADSVNSVVAISGPDGAVGTGVMVRPSAVLTALHVVEGIPPGALRVDRRSVEAIRKLPIRRLGRAGDRAARSAKRLAALSDTDVGTVDLALLAVTGLDRPVATARNTPVKPGDRLVVAGYPTGRWALTSGPVTGVDDADYLTHVMLGPGFSGAPTIDADGEIAGLVSMDHLSAGAVVIGPELVAEFVETATRRRWHRSAR